MLSKLDPHFYKRVLRIFFLVAIWFVACPVHTVLAAKCDFDGINGDYPDHGDISALAEGIVNENLTCFGADCDLDGMGGVTPDVGDLAVLMDMATTGSNTGECKRSMNFPKGEIWVPASGVDIVDPIDKTTVSFPAGSMGSGGFVRIEEPSELPDLDDIVLVGPTLSISLSSELITAFSVVIPKHLANERVASEAGAEIEIFVYDPVASAWNAVPTWFNPQKNGYEGLVEISSLSWRASSSRRASSDDPNAVRMAVAAQPMEPYEQGCLATGGHWNTKYCECPLNNWWADQEKWGEKSKKGKCEFNGSLPSTDGTFSFMTWNIGNVDGACNKNEKLYKLCRSSTEKNVSKMIKQKNPDIVFLQEVFPWKSYIAQDKTDEHKADGDIEWCGKDEMGGAVEIGEFHSWGGSRCGHQVSRILSGYDFLCTDGMGGFNGQLRTNLSIGNKGGIGERKGNGWECIAYKPGIVTNPVWKLPDGPPEKSDKGDADMNQDLALILEERKNGGNVNFINVHLASPQDDKDVKKNSKTRLKQVEKLRGVVGAMAANGELFYMAGDFNVDIGWCSSVLGGKGWFGQDPDSACEMKKWEQEGIGSHVSFGEKTVFYIAADLQLDYVFGNKKVSGSQKCAVQGKSGGTDHRAYYCPQLKWPSHEIIVPSLGTANLICPNGTSEVNGVCKPNAPPLAVRTSPSGLSGNQKPQRKLVLTWAHDRQPGQDADFYRIRWSTSSGLPDATSGKLTENEAVSSNGQKSYTADKLQSDTTYYFRIYSCKAGTPRSAPVCDLAGNEWSAKTHSEPQGQLLRAQTDPPLDQIVQMQAGGKKLFSVSYQVTGKDPWPSQGEHRIQLGTDRGAGRSSLFANSSWLGNDKNRPAGLAHLVNTGQIATFTFEMQAPSQGRYHECFSPVAEGLYWILPNETCWIIQVNGDPGQPATPVVSTDRNHYKASDVTFQDPGAPFNMTKGTIRTVTLKYRNDGPATWYKTGQHAVHLGTNNARDRVSPFCHSSWIGDSCDRPAELTEAEVPPGGTGTFTFILQANTAGVAPFKEYFAPVAENLVWMKEDHAYWTITVTDPLPALNLEVSFDGATGWGSSVTAAQNQSYWFRLTGGPPGSAVTFQISGQATGSLTKQTDPNGSGVWEFPSACDRATGQYTLSFTHNGQTRSVMENRTAGAGCGWDTDRTHYVASDVTFQNPGAPFSMIRGTTQTVTLKYRNDGQATWYQTGQHAVLLGTNHPRDRFSDFYHSSWIKPNRPARLQENTVPPGGTGTFIFTIQAPYFSVTQAKEYFAPVAENIDWLKEDHAYWSITVTDPPLALNLEASLNGSSDWGSAVTVAQNQSYWIRLTGGPSSSVVTLQFNGQATGAFTRQTDANGSVVWEFPSACDRAAGQYTISFTHNGQTRSITENRTAAAGCAWDTDRTHYVASDVTFQNPGAPFSMIRGTTQTVTLKYRNDGQATWYQTGQHAVLLGTNHPRDRFSDFYHSSWIKPNRPARLQENTVPPGGTGTFIFTIQAPYFSVTQAKEYFAPVAENIDWMKEDHAYWTITVP